MTTLQEAAQAAMKYIRSTADYKAGHPVAIEAAEDLSDALAQQGEQQPVCHGCGIPAGDVHMSTCKSGKWPSRVSNGDTAAPAPVAQQGEQQQVVKEVVVHADYRAMWQEVTRQNQQLCAALSAAPAPQAQPDWLLKTTQDLANSIRRRCFPEVPQFQVLDDLAGVISQIDNMTCGMERKSAPQAQDKSDNYLSGYCTGRTDLLKEQSAQPVAQPLTLEQILDIVKKLDETPDMSHVDVLKTFARAIEAAHGIMEVK